jgi:hypothetical protein
MPVRFSGPEIATLTLLSESQPSSFLHDLVAFGIVNLEILTVKPVALDRSHLVNDDASP